MLKSWSLESSNFSGSICTLLDTEDKWTLLHAQGGFFPQAWGHETPHQKHHHANSARHGEGNFTVCVHIAEGIIKEARVCTTELFHGALKMHMMHTFQRN